MTAGRFVLFAPLQSLLAFWMDGNDERVARTPLRRVDMAWLRDDTGAVGLGDGVRDGQHQAAAALGLTRFAAFRYVVLPQAVRIATPPLAGQYMNVIKNSSLTMAIGLAELSYSSRQVETETLKTFQSFGMATVLYIVAIAAIEVALLLWQRRRASAARGWRLSRGDR